MVLVWLCLVVAFCVLELSGTKLIAIWFAAGSLAAAVASLFDAKNLTLQIVVFLLASVALFALRPIAYRYMKAWLNPITDAANYEGMRCYVVEPIDNEQHTGKVSDGAKTWHARSRDDVIIEADAWVEVVDVVGEAVVVVEK